MKTKVGVEPSAPEIRREAREMVRSVRGDAVDDAKVRALDVGVGETRCENADAGTVGIARGQRQAGAANGKDGFGKLIEWPRPC